MSTEKYAGPIAVDRPLTEHEYKLTKWILENGIPEGHSFVEQLDKARVCFLCGCGCASIDFSIEGAPRAYGPMKILGDFHFGSAEENNYSEIFVFAVEGKLAGLEVVEYVETTGVLPQPSELRQY